MSIINSCRACLLQKDTKELCDWYMSLDDISEPLTLLECFQICTQIDVKKTNSMSSCITNMHYLCQDCLHELIDAFRFIRKAQKSDQELCILSQKNVATSESQLAEFELVNMQMCGSSSHSVGSVEEISYQENLAVEDIIQKQREFRNSKNLNNSPETQQPTLSSEEDRNSDISDSEIDLFSKIETTELCYLENSKKINIDAAETSTFNDAVRLKRHEYTNEENRERTLSCEQCQRKFLTQRAYQNHSKTHEKNREPKFKCDECKKCFFYNGSLKLHKQTHIGLPFECNVCSKQYARSVDLQIHLRSHSGELPYKCPKCNKGFRYVHVLNKHVRHHEGHRYKCNLCGKEYAHQSTMLQHRKEHTGLPLRCSICDKGFVKKSKMRRHISGVHKVGDIEEIDQLILKVKTKNIYRGRVMEM